LLLYWPGAEYIFEYMKLAALFLCAAATVPCPADEAPDQNAPAADTQEFPLSDLYPIALTAPYTKHTFTPLFPVDDAGADAFKKGMTALAKRHFSKAKKEFQEAGEKSPLLAPYAQCNEFIACLGDNTPEEAAALLTALESKESPAQVQVNAAVALLKSGLLKKGGQATAFCARIAGRAPANAEELRYLLGNEYFDAEQFDKALAEYMSVIQNSANSPFADSVYQRYAQIRKTGTSVSADQEYQTAKYLALRFAWDKVWDIAYPLSRKKSRLARESFILALQAAFGQGKFKKALDMAITARKNYPSEPLFAYYMGRCCKKLKMNQTANKYYLDYVRRFPQHAHCDNVLWEIARTYEDDKNLDRAIHYFGLIDARYKNGSYGEKARWRMGYCHYKKGDRAAATTVWKGHAKRYPLGFETEDCCYWTGKVCEEQKKTNEAVQWYLSAIRYNFFSYYAYRARERLDSLSPDSLAALLRANDSSRAAVTVERFLSPGSAIVPQSQTALLGPETEKAYRAGTVLLQAGCYNLAFEALRPFEKESRKNPFLHYHLVRLYEANGFVSEAYRTLRPLLWKIPEGLYGVMPLEIARCFFPRYYGEFITAECKKYGLDPLLVHSLILQESMYQYRVVSPAGALGLMQIMPYTGTEIAAKLNTPFTPDSLFNPACNIAFGAWYFNAMLNRFGNDPVLAFCAYNAGPQAAERWRTVNKNRPFDAFVEEIGYTETRYYAKKCMKNYWVYRDIWND